MLSTFFYDCVCCNSLMFLQFYTRKKRGLLLLASHFDSMVDFKILVVRVPSVKDMGLKAVVLTSPKRVGSHWKQHFSILGLILSFLLQWYRLLRSSFQRSCNSDLKKRSVVVGDTFLSRG
jgi:hypothetical protein